MHSIDSTHFKLHVSSLIFKFVFNIELFKKSLCLMGLTRKVLLQ